jgi:hypothetical protein
MNLRTWLIVLGCAAGCADGTGARGTDFTGDPSTQDGDEDGDANPSDDGDAVPTDDEAESDAGGDDDDGAPEGDAGTRGPDGGGLLDPILEYTTCEPDEINPVVECLTVTCTMTLDPVALVQCMLEQCAPLVEAVNPKCKECITAAVAQDTTGLLQNCLKLEAVPGTGTSAP